ncbi:LppU/SCO3897 family protein [Streptomyces sp. BR1]|uniref:LppU/SCO3897 family protein n=1 Tax=Streptomyces sp. BR1 TaxID=1592323 RepID=UPI00402BF3D1
MSTPPPQGQNPYAPQPNAPYGQPQGAGPYGPPQGGAPYGQQPGQPGVPQQPSPYMHQGAPIPHAPAPAPPRRNVKKIVRIVIAVSVLFAAAVGWYTSRHDADTAKVGDCMSIGNPASTTHPDLKVVSCDDSKAKYKVVEKKDDNSGCDRTKYSEYTQTGGSKDFTLCLEDYKK